MTIRLQKYMAMCGIASRRKCEEIIALGRVQLNGVTVMQPGQSVETNTDIVLVDGNPIAPSQKKIYIALYKPQGVVTTIKDTHGRKTVIDCLPDLDERVFPVGRLDMNTEGLLLLTNDGEFANGVMHPSNDTPKEYLLSVRGRLSPQAIQELRNGIELEEGTTRPCTLKDIIYNNASTSLKMVLHEGKNRQIRRMIEKVGYRVLYLKRLRVGPIDLTGLDVGGWRYLTQEEIDKLYIKK